MINITNKIAIKESDFNWRFIRASGPGGQNVNKVATAVQLRFDVKHCPVLPQAVRIRLQKLAGRRMTAKGVLVIDARRYRTRERNRQDALERLVALLRRATKVPKPRRKTKPTVTAKKRRLQEKRQQGETKRLRRPVPHNEL